MEKANFSINPNFTETVLWVGDEKTPVVIIDDFAQAPQDLIEYAKTHCPLIPTKVDTNYYPGAISAAASQQYTDNMYAALKPIIKKAYRLPVGYPSWIDSSYAMVNFSPKKLAQSQRIPHYDSQGPGQLAFLLYLCHPPHQGTALYRHKKTGFESIQPARAEQFLAAIDPKLASNDYPDQYINEGNDDFEQIAKLDLAFNRLIIYPSQSLHSSLIVPELLSDDMDKGRLTLRTFVNYQ